MALRGLDLVAQIKKQIKEVTPRETAELLACKAPVTVLDVREDDETANGIIQGAICIPRGKLELSIDDKIPDRGQDIIIYCAGGNRSAFAAETLKRMGYEKVASMSGGFLQWKRDGFPVHVRKVLSADQKSRYSRHLLLPEIGEEGQLKLLHSKVLLVGAGGLGSPAALYLAAAGVGTIGIVDNDVVDASNLQRQVVHNLDWVGKPKTESAKNTIVKLNPDVNVRTYDTFVTRDNILDIIKDYDVIADGCDNFPTRYLINDACVFTGKPNVHGSIFRFEGQATVFYPGQGPCYRCLYPDPPPPGMAPSCQEAGVLGVLPGIVGTIQAIETIKLIAGVGQPLTGRLLQFDSLKMKFREFKLRRDTACKVCGEHPTVTELIDYEHFCSAAAAE